MGLFNFHRKKTTFLDDPYTVRFELDDEFLPQNNADVKKALDQVSDSERNNGEPAILDTAPFATFQTVEEFFSALRTISANTATPITFKYLAIWAFDKNSKTKMGKKGSSNGNPHEFVTLNRPGYQFEVDYSYQNLTKYLFESIFNDPANTDISYEDKVSYCNTLKSAYLESTGGTDDDVAKLPDAKDADNGAVSLQIPAFNTIKNPPQQENVPVYDPASATISEQKSPALEHADNSNGNANPVVAPALNQDGVRTFDQVPEKPIKKKAKEERPVESKRSEKRSVTQEVDDENAIAREKGHIIAPQYDVEELEQVEPGHHGYVKFEVNQKRKTLNKRLLVIADKISDQNEKAILQRREEYRKKIDSAIAEFDKKHKNDTDQIFNDIQTELLKEKTKKLNDEVEKINHRVKDEKADARRAYEKSLQDIDSRANTDKKSADTNLIHEYESRAKDLFAQATDKNNKKVSLAREKLRHQLDRKYELKSREDATKLRAEGNDTMSKVLLTMNKELDEFETNATSTHINAKQVAVAEKREQNEKERLHAPFKDLQHANSQIADLRGQLAKAQADLATYQKSSGEYKAQAEAAQNKIEAQAAEMNSLVNKSAAESINKGNKESMDMLTKFINLQLAKTLASDKDDNQKSKDDETVKNVVKGAKRLAVGLIAVILLLVGGGAYYIHSQAVANAERVAAVQQTMARRVKAAQTANTQKQPSQADIDRAALVALHSNNQAKLDKYQNESYYQLDKAIINNDANAANSAVQAMGDNLGMHDRYRAAQAQSLLKTAGNDDLATKVGDANK